MQELEAASNSRNKGQPEFSAFCSAVEPVLFNFQTKPDLVGTEGFGLGEQ
jgi:hypothetical protein